MDFNLDLLAETAILQAKVGAVTIGQMAGLPIAELGVVYKERESGTPATKMGDRAAERMREVTKEAFPDNSVRIINEELGDVGPTDAPLVCYEDPDDGSSLMLNWEQGDPLPVTGVSYVGDGKLLVSAVGDFTHQQVVYFVAGYGAFVVPLGGGEAKKLLPVEAHDHKRSFVFTDALLNPFTLEGNEPGKASAQLLVMGAGRMLNAVGKFAQNSRTQASCLVHLAKLAKGLADIVVIHAMSGYWDIGIHGACQAVGCRVTDIFGNDIEGPGPGEDGSYPFLLGTAPGIDHDYLLEQARIAYGKDYAGFRGPNYQGRVR